MRELKSHELRTHLRDALDSVRAGEHVRVLRYDRVEAVLVSPGWYEEATALMRDGDVGSDEEAEQ